MAFPKPLINKIGAQGEIYCRDKAQKGAKKRRGLKSGKRESAVAGSSGATRAETGNFNREISEISEISRGGVNRNGVSLALHQG